MQLTGSHCVFHPNKDRCIFQLFGIRDSGLVGIVPLQLIQKCLEIIRMPYLRHRIGSVKGVLEMLQHISAN